jgi:branched-subunit amino acid ABC-type transport system permease component
VSLASAPGGAAQRLEEVLDIGSYFVLTAFVVVVLGGKGEASGTLKKPIARG